MAIYPRSFEAESSTLSGGCDIMTVRAGDLREEAAPLATPAFGLN
jgi:hypothetical protein